MSREYKHVVNFSGGRSSAYMLIKMVEQNAHIDAIIFQNTGKEKEATLIFVKQVAEYINRPIVWIEYADNENGFVVVDFNTASRNGEPFAALIAKRKFLPNVVSRFCTQELKIRPAKKYLKSLVFTNWYSYTGIRYDEPQRWGRLMQNAHKDCWLYEMPMVDWKIDKEAVLTYWQKMPFDLNLKQFEGNCDLCFLKGKFKKLQILRDNPATADWWQKQEEITGATFVKDLSIKQLKESASQPLIFEEYGDIDFPCFCNAD